MLAATLLSLSFAMPGPQEPPLRAIVVTGANNHDWQWTAPEIAAALRETGRFEATVDAEPAKLLADLPARRQRGEVDVIVLDYNGPRWGEAAEQGFVGAVRDGCGVVVLHAANNAFPGWREYEQMVGLLWRDGTGHGDYHPFDVYVVDANHPITDGMADLQQHPDELYHRLVLGAGADFKVLLSAYSDPARRGTGRHEPMATVGTFGKGRVFHTPLGHVWHGVPQSRATWADPQLRRLVARGAEWAATGAVTLAPTPLNRLAAAERADGFELLFDGASLEHWQGYRGGGQPSAGWSVRDAAIVHAAGGGGGDLVSAQQYGDFDFRFAFRLAKGANSGVLWHVVDGLDETYLSGPEYQLYDAADDQVDAKHAVAALYDLVPATDPPPLPAGAWNEGRIVVHAGRVQHWLNGKQVVDAPCKGPAWDALVQHSKFRDWPFAKTDGGRIALQDHGDEVAFRDLRIKRL